MYKIDNQQDLMYSTGNSTQYCVITHKGKEFEKEYTYSFPGDTSDKESACQCRKHEVWFQSLSREDPLDEGIATHISILAWRIQGQRRLVSYSP